MENNTIVYNKNQFLYADDYSTATIILVEQACSQYQRVFDKNDVPFSYIEFFLSEFNKYSSLFEGKLKDYYNGYKFLGLTVTDLINRYKRSYFSQHKSIKTTKDESYLVFNSHIETSFTKNMRKVVNTNMSTLAENIIHVCNKIEKQDELVSLVELYEMFMIDKFILSHDFGQNVKTVSKVKTSGKSQVEKADSLITNTDNSSNDKSNNINKTSSTTLVGNAIKDEYQNKGKTTRVIIPKLKLPSNYPIYETSRVEKSKRARVFLSPAKQIIFINHHKIVAVKYSSNFLEKRKPKKAKKKFDWDF